MFVQDHANLIETLALVDMQRLRAVEAASGVSDQDLVSEEGSVLGDRGGTHAGRDVDPARTHRRMAGLLSGRGRRLAEGAHEGPVQTDTPELEVGCVRQERASRLLKDVTG